MGFKRTVLWYWCMECTLPCVATTRSQIFFLLFSFAHLSQSHLHQAHSQLASLAGPWIFPSSQPRIMACFCNDLSIRQDTALAVHVLDHRRLAGFHLIFFFHSRYRLFEDKDWILSSVCNFQHWGHCPKQSVCPINFNGRELPFLL